MNDKTVALVFGYLRNIDRISGCAKKMGLTKRFAVVLDTFRESKGEMYFDYELIENILSAFDKSIKYNKMRICNPKSEKCFESISEWHHDFLGKNEDERSSFSLIEYIEDDKVVCRVETDDWTGVGGPHPYHDSYTFSFYLREYKREEVQERIYKACVENNALIRDILSVLDSPHTSLGHRLTWIIRFFS